MSPALALALVTVAAGCGGSGGTHGFTLAATQKCLHEAGFIADRDENKLLKGSGGNLEIQFGYGTPRVFVVFGKDAAEARMLENRAVAATVKYDSIAREVVLAGVQRTGNVFVYSDTGPLNQVARSRVSGCLKT